MTTNIVNVYDPQQFGVGDGATTEFRIGGPREVVTSMTPTGVWRQDWQGNLALYSTPRMNLLRFSEDFTQGLWGKGGCSVTPNAIAAPDGRPIGQKIIESATTGEHYFEQNPIPADTTQPFTRTVYLKGGERTLVNIRCFCSNSGNVYVGVVFDTVSGTFLNPTGNGGVSSYSATDVGDGWWRVAFTCQFTVVDTALRIRTYLVATATGTSYPGDGVSGAYLQYQQLEAGTAATSYIPTGSTAETLTDYTVSSTGLVSMGQVPAIGASLTWTGSYTYEYQDDAPTLADRTVISQYANSPTLRQLIRNMDECINPDTDFDAFYDYVWNVETAQGFGLDIWGRIVGVGRMLTVPGAETYLGYQEAYTTPTAATGAQPFGQAPMYTGVPSTQTYRLADDAYRKLILVKALANISDCTSPGLNRLLSNLFAGRGRCYVTDTGQMEFRYVFEFALEPYEIAILTQSGAIPKPAAVLANVLQVDLPTTFGFNEAAMQPFGSGVFFTPSGLIHASQ